MFQNLKIRTLSKIMSLTLIFALVFVGISSLMIHQKTKDMEEKWTSFERKTAQKTLLLSQIRALMGYDGVIHHFKNYVLRKERWRIFEVHKKLIEMNIALSAYQSLGMTTREEESFRQFVETVQQYKEYTVVAEKLADDHRLANEIDQYVQIDDTQAVQSLRHLEESLTLAYQQSAQHVALAIKDIRWIASMAGVVITLFIVGLSLVAVAFIQYRIATPLDLLSRSISRLNPKDPGNKRLEIDPGWGDTEITSFAKSANNFIAQVTRNIQNKRYITAQLRDSEEYLRNIVNNAVDAIITIDEKGRIVSYNASASTLFYYLEHEMIGQNISKLMPEPDRSHHQHYINHYLETKDSHVIGVDREIKGQRKDGSIFPMRLGLSQINTSKGIFFTGIIRDLSQQKNDEERLNMARIAAEEANHAKSEFLSSMSHELRTPMNAVNGFTQLMLTSHSNPPTEMQREYLNHILKSGNHLMELIDQVLELNKIETGHVNVTLMETDVRALVEDCISHLHTRADDNNITLENRLGPDLPEILFTDQTRLKQILYNLISNAIKYNKPDGFVFLDCRRTKSDKIRLAVHDSGLGIPKDMQAKVFQPFDRLGRENGEIDGTGIGLTITQKLARAINADVGFTSTEGDGSVFWVDLPLQTSFDDQNYVI